MFLSVCEDICHYQDQQRHVNVYIYTYICTYLPKWRHIFHSNSELVSQGELRLAQSRCGAILLDERPMLLKGPAMGLAW